jgi:hypothetical protein
MRSDISISRRRLLQAGALAGVSAFAGGLVGAERAYAGSHPFTPNQALLNAFIARRGGSIGTGGKPAVAFRCDHHLNRFASMLLPLHRKYNIPVTLAFGSQVLKREVGHDGSHLLTFPGIEKMSLENGFEIANHGATHQGAVTSAEIRAEFVYSKRDLQKAMPRLPIEIFSPAGVGKTSFGGFYGARTQTDYERCLAGRIIVQNHAMATGYVPGYWGDDRRPAGLHGCGAHQYRERRLCQSGPAIRARFRDPGPPRGLHVSPQLHRFD